MAPVTSVRMGGEPTLARLRCGRGAPPHLRARAGRRAGAGRLVGRDPGAARDPRPVRRRDRRRGLGADAVQPRAGAGRGARRVPRPRSRLPTSSARAGLVVFAAASLGCALAPASRCCCRPRRAGVGGAAAVCAALELLPAQLGSERRAAAVWAAAGALRRRRRARPSAAALTEAITWEAIFLVQVPLALAGAGAAAAPGDATPGQAPAGRPHIAANVALGLLSAALTAALFLVVLLLINGWGHTPAGRRGRRHGDAAGLAGRLPAAAATGARPGAGGMRRDPGRRRTAARWRCCPAPTGGGWWPRRS